MLKVNFVQPIFFGGDYTVDYLIERGDYKYVNQNINPRNFPMRSSFLGLKGIKICSIDSELFDLDEIEIESVFLEAKKKELKRPSYEDALYFGAQAFKKFERMAIAFLHEPVIINGQKRVIVFSHNRRMGHDIYLEIFNGKCNKNYFFAFI